MMKKRWILLMMCACISGLGGCGKQTITEKAEETETADSMKEDTTELCAYIKEINGNTLVIDPVEYISSGDSDRLASYKHTDDDMPDGYYIYNKDEKTEDVTLTDQTENCGSSGCDACGSTHRHDECGGLPGTVFSYDKNGAGW